MGAFSLDRVLDPAIGRVLASVADGTVDDAMAAVDAAAGAATEWAATAIGGPAASVRGSLTWCESCGAGPMTRTSLNTWITEMLDAGAAPGTARTRQLAMRRFSAWLIAVGRLPADPFLGIKGPKQHHPVVTPLTDYELRALIANCTAPTRRPDEPLHHHRDEAIIRLDAARTASKRPAAIAASRRTSSREAATALAAASSRTARVAGSVRSALLSRA